MKMRKGSGEIGCLFVMIVVGFILIGACESSRSHEERLTRMECDAIRESSKTTSLREKILEEEVRQLKALIPTNVTLKIELSDIIKETNGSSASH